VNSTSQSPRLSARRSNTWTYEEAERYLLSLEPLGWRFGLDRIRRLVTLLGMPQHRFASIHVGRGFRFGHLRAADLRALEAIGAASGFAVVGVSPVEVEGETVSSTAVRQAVEDGDVVRAGAMLGRPFEVTGTVVRGEGRGRKLRFPTANVAVENEMVPRRGVYVTDTVAFAQHFPSVTNVGVRPTFQGTSVTVESHLLDVDEDLYGARIDVRFLARLRDEMRFDGPGALADQIARDAAAATSYFAGLSVARRSG
jgi:riboflavin kinase/FMN adenylyltransferase